MRLHNAIKEGKKILLEGQLGSLKDPDHGIYPMVTSSSTLAAYGAIGAGIPPYEIKDITTVVKAYSSAVGADMQIRHIHMDGSFHGRLLTHRTVPLDLTEVCGTDAQEVRS